MANDFTMTPEQEWRIYRARRRVEYCDARTVLDDIAEATR